MKTGILCGNTKVLQEILRDFNTSIYIFNGDNKKISLLFLIRINIFDSQIEHYLGEFYNNLILGEISYQIFQLAKLMVLLFDV